MAEPVLGYLKYRVTNWFVGYSALGVGSTVVVPDLAHLHQSVWTDRGMQQGAPASVAIGDFSIPLHPPGSEGYAANWALYQLLLPGSGEGLRVEAYLGDTFGGSVAAVNTTQTLLSHAGIITEVILSNDPPKFELRGKTDAWVLAMNRPYPGEALHNSLYDSVTIAKQFIPVNIPVVTDTFNPYTAANYTSTNLPTTSAGTWASTTDANGVNSHVVSCSTGTGAVLINKTSFALGNADTMKTQMVECIVRLKPSSTSTTNAGQVGVGFSASSANANDSILHFVAAKWNTTTSRYDLDVALYAYVGGVLGSPLNLPNALTNVDDPDGYIPLQLQIIQQYDSNNIGYIRFVVNGSPVNAVQTGPTYGIQPVFPMFMFAAPSSGTSVAYFTNMLGAQRGNGPFLYGTIGSPTHKFRVNQALPPTFLDILTAACTQESWYWRLRPISQDATTTSAIAYVDMGTQPGIDYSASVIFEEGQNLLGITQQGNADSFASDVQFNGPSDTSSGGVHYGRNLTAMTTYGWLSGVSMTTNVQDYASLQRQGANVSTNKGTPGASYTARVIRDPSTADRYRELDYVTINAPTLGINHKKMLVLARTFTEGSPEETLVLGQYGTADMVAANRMMPGLNQMAGLFKNR